MSRFLGALLILVLVLFVRWIGVETEADTLLVGAGMLLVFTYLAGRAGRSIMLPQITGYLLLGIFIGPSLLGLYTENMVKELRLVNNLAVSLIALTAGAEIQLSWLKARARSLGSIMVFQNGLLLLVVSGVFFGLRHIAPMMQHADWHIDLVIALLLGSFAVASSPSVVVAMISETRSNGPVSQTVLGVTVLKDLAVIVLFTVVVAYGKSNLGGQEIGGGVVLDLLRETLGSILLGIPIGILMALYLRKIGKEIPLVTIVACFGIAEVGQVLHTEPLLMGMTAGFFLRNFYRGAAETLIHGLERLNLPVYCLFFGLAGLSLKAGAIATLGGWALLFAAIRLVLLMVGTRVGAVIGQSEETVKRHAWLGFISQAGVTLAMAAIVARTFPEWGPTVQALTVTIIALNQLIGPPMFKLCLNRALESREVWRTPVPEFVPVRRSSR